MVKTLQQVGYEPSRFYVTVFKNSTSGSSIIIADRARSHEILELCLSGFENQLISLLTKKIGVGGDLAGNNTKKKNIFKKSGNGSSGRVTEFCLSRLGWYPAGSLGVQLVFIVPDVVNLARGAMV